MRASAAFAGRMMVLGVLAQGGAAHAEDGPLHSLIDQRLTPVAGVDTPRCSDADYLRRVSLDLTGMPPTADEARAFIADPAADKRARLVERLFASPHHARHLATTLDLMLMERRANTHVTADEWQAWLLKAVRDNKPWNVLAREILLADGDDPALRPAARFALDRASEANVLARDIGRIFFGRDMQCAQCHDHPLVGDYLQSDYHGLLAFVSPGHALAKTVGDKQVTLHAENAGAELTFQSVFVGVPHRTGARMPDDVELEEPSFLPGEEYEVAPAANTKPVPKFSRRGKLAELATNGANRAFNRNIVNRLWAHMFGRGLVHPQDLHHPDNPATDPELLRILSEHFAAMSFDIRAFLREIAISEAYQRAFDPPADLLALSAQAQAEVSGLEQQHATIEQESDTSTDMYTKASDTWEQAEASWLPVAGELDATRAKYVEAKTKLDEATKALADTKAQLEAKQKVAAPVEQAGTAAQAAAQALPEDKELADAAQKFVARSQQLAAEVVALSKAVEEKNAAVQPSTDALTAAKTAVEAAQTKVTPLKVAVRDAERAMLAARREAAQDAEALAALDRRVATMRGIAQLSKIDEAIAAANAAVPVRESELAAAQTLLNDYAATIAQNEAAVKTETDANAAATMALDIANAEHAKRLEVAQAIAAAFASADAAKQKVPADAVLADAAAKLQERASAAQTETGESQKQVDAAAAAQKPTADALAAAQKSLAEAVAERTSREQKIAAANEVLAAAKAQAAAKQSEFDTAMAELTDRLTHNFTIASLKPLTPEQLCWSVFRVTGVYDRYWQTEVAELDKTKPLTEEQKKDPAQLAVRDIELEQRTFDKLKGNVATFVAFYGAAAGQPQGDFFSTADQALFAANGGSVNSWVAPAGDNVTERITKQADPRVAAEELYLSVLTRLPTEEEITEVVNYLTNRAADKNIAAQELVWGLLNSAEFRFNH